MNYIKEFWDTITCGILLVLGFATNSPVFFVLAIVIGGYKQTLEGIQDTLENKHLNVELLMILSALGACLIGYYSEGAVLIFIFAVSGALEEMTLDQSKREINSLMAMQPETAQQLLEDGSTRTVQVETLNIGDKVIVARGAGVPIDGKIISGETALEEAAITGESVPRNKTIGDRVFGGTLNVSSPITIEVDEEPGNTMLQKIVKMVDDAQNYPSKTARFIDKIESYYAAGVLVVVALFIAIPTLLMNVPFEAAFYRGMILLVVASPCALIASVTPATLAAISNGAKHGILVKGGIHFENLMDLKAIAFDKTGTLTEGEMRVTDVYLNDETLRGIVVALERHSTHPLAQAIVKEMHTGAVAVQDIEELPGFGVRGLYQGKLYKVGRNESSQALSEPMIALEAAWMAEGKTLVYIQEEETIVGIIGLIDTLRPDAIALISWLNEQNIQTVMITGDNQETANKIAEAVGVQHVIARTLPNQKADIINNLIEEYGDVAMVGDGINDAPALANATIGIAMGGGTDIAIEAADIILVHNNIENIRYAYTLSQRLRRIVIQNIVFSFSVILLLVSANFMGDISLPLGVVGHEGSTILVILNSLRLLKPLVMKDTVK